MQHSKLLYSKGLLRNRRMLTQSQYTDYKFIARLDHIKTFCAGIKALCFGDYGMFQMNEDGFRVTVEQGKVVQASLFMIPAVFEEYHVMGMVNFSLKMSVLAECLSIFAGIDCSMKMLYKGDSAPLLLMLEPHEDEDISTECSIKTVADEQPIDFQLDENSASLNVIFIRGPDLAQIFHDLDSAAEEYEIRLSPHRPHFKIDSVGVMQSQLCVEVPKTSDMMLMFNCRETTKARYKATLIKLTNKALTVASKVAIKTDLSGILEMHFMLQTEENSDIYVQFFVTPQVANDEMDN